MTITEDANTIAQQFVSARLDLFMFEDTVLVRFALRFQGISATAFWPSDHTCSRWHSDEILFILEMVDGRDLRSMAR